jgi:hypothetical protein
METHRMPLACVEFTERGSKFGLACASPGSVESVKVARPSIVVLVTVAFSYDGAQYS